VGTTHLRDVSAPQAGMPGKAVHLASVGPIGPPPAWIPDGPSRYRKLGRARTTSPHEPARDWGRIRCRNGPNKLRGRQPLHRTTSNDIIAVHAGDPRSPPLQQQPEPAPVPFNKAAGESGSCGLCGRSISASAGPVSDARLRRLVTPAGQPTLFAINRICNQ
jgi:hypothetical protein